ncbi:MAG: hypothetical protein IPP74_05260 [Alphaproteobacteria bacterium]|nr:hypothetical protein [Alphaproteobacteria bacterium]
MPSAAQPAWDWAAKGVGDAATKLGFTLDQSAKIGQFTALGVGFLKGESAGEIQISNATALQAINFNLLLEKSSFAGDFIDSVGKGMKEGNQIIDKFVSDNTPGFVKKGLGAVSDFYAEGVQSEIMGVDLGLRLTLGNEQVDAFYDSIGAKKDAAGAWLYDQFTPDQLYAIVGFGSVYLARIFAPAPEAVALKSGLGGALEQSETGIVWGGGIKSQGIPWEDTLANSLGADNRLPFTMSTFDFYDPTIGLATSAKTLDTLTVNRLENPNTVYNTLVGYIDKTANFQKAKIPGTGQLLTADEINSRSIQLAVPSDTTPAQWQQIGKAVDYGNQMNVNVIVTRIR